MIEPPLTHEIDRASEHNMPYDSLKIKQGLTTFARDESGAVTTDYIILTGAIVGLGLSATVSVRNGVGSLGADIEGSLSGTQVAALNFVPYTGPPLCNGHSSCPP
jgi:Flp pilus assembly pilin Flp